MIPISPNIFNTSRMEWECWGKEKKTEEKEEEGK